MSKTDMSIPKRIGTAIAAILAVTVAIGLSGDTVESIKKSIKNRKNESK